MRFVNLFDDLTIIATTVLLFNQKKKSYRNYLPLISEATSFFIIHSKSACSKGIIKNKNKIRNGNLLRFTRLPTRRQRRNVTNPIPLRFARGVGRLCADIKKSTAQLGSGLFGTRNGNRTHNYPLGGGYYIHLTMQASIQLNKSLYMSRAEKDLLSAHAWAYGGPSGARTQDQPVMSR